VEANIDTMTTQELKVFENKKIRSVWDDTQDKWLFSVIDIVEALTDSPTRKDIGAF